MSDMKKKLNYLFILVLVSPFLMISCVDEPEVEKNPPTITFTSPVSDTIDVFIGDSIDFEIELTAEDGLKSLLALSSVAGVELLNFDQDFNGTSYESVTVTAVLTESVEADAEIVISFVVSDNSKSVNAQKVLIAKVKATPLSEAADFTWQRTGAPAATGLTEFGLSWESNGADGKFAIIKKDADKFVILDPAQWTTITSLEALKAAVDAADNVESWKGVSAEASGSYDFTLGTIKNDTYYLIHITNGEVKSVTAGTQITITGQYKK